GPPGLGAPAREKRGPGGREIGRDSLSGLRTRHDRPLVLHPARSLLPEAYPPHPFADRLGPGAVLLEPQTVRSGLPARRASPCAVCYATVRVRSVGGALGRLRGGGAA